MQKLLKKIRNIQKALNPKVHELQENLNKRYNLDIDIDDLQQLQEIASVLNSINVPDWHIKNNPSIRRIVISPDNSFYSKHNRKTKTITLSNQLFTPEFKQQQPHHRIAHIPSLHELLMHEIGHSVDQYRDEAKLPNYYKQFGWAIANNPQGGLRLKNEGFDFALDSFRRVPKEKLTTVDNEDAKQIEERIKGGGFYQKPDKKMKLSWYGLTSPREDFAESYVNYVFNPVIFKKIEPERYDFLKTNIFNAKEYLPLGIKKAIKRIKSVLKTPLPYSSILPIDSDLNEPYGNIPLSLEDLKHRKELAAKVTKIKKSLEVKQYARTR